MLRSRLKNIINKSKELSNKQEVGNPFDEFKKSLPEELKIDDNYRLEAAWKAYGSPKDYKHALWEGMIQPIDETNVKLPSIGYNEETDEYEYLNKGEDNETVAKDIRVWDNDVIPLVQELKLGGYIRLYNKEKDCWTYTKNQSLEVESFKSGGKKKIKVKTEDGGFIEIDSLDEDLKAGRKSIGKYKGVDLYMKGDGTCGPNYNGKQVTNKMEAGGEIIDSFLKDGNFNEWYKKVPKNKSNTDDYDLEKAYNELIKTEEGQKELEDFINIPEKYLSGDYKKPNHPTYGGYGGWINKNNLWNYYISPILIENYPKRDLNWYKNYWDLYEPESILHWIDGSIYKRGVLEFKQGGQMNVIPDGALHARKNNMELAKEGEITHKGIPVVDNNGEQQAEIEKEEWTMTKELTDDVEKWYREYYKEDVSQKDKDELAIKCGKRIVKELLHNTDDRANLIAKMLEEEE